MPPVFVFIWLAAVIFIIWANVKKAKGGANKNGSNINGAKNLCSNCGKYVNANAYTCPYCGAALKKKCPRCGQWVNMRSKYCTACNAPLDNGVSSAADNTQCTYHDTYSTGYDPHCHNPHDDLSRYTRRRSIDDIGLVKGRGRNKIETVEEYEKSRHREGAYHVNVNDVNSNYKMTSPEQYSRKSSVTVRSVDGTGTAKNQNTGNKKAANKSGCGIVVFIIIACVAAIAVNVINTIKDETDNTSSNYYDDYYYYSTFEMENLTEEEIATNAMAQYYYDYIKNVPLTDSNDLNFVIYYNDTENNTIQCLLYRVTQNSKSYTGRYYYNKASDHFFFDRYENDIDMDIFNKLSREDKEIYIQVDYVEFERQGNETMRENVSIMVDYQYCAYSYAESTEPLIITPPITID